MLLPCEKLGGGTVFNEVTLTAQRTNVDFPTGLNIKNAICIGVVVEYGKRWYSIESLGGYYVDYPGGDNSIPSITNISLSESDYSRFVGKKAIAIYLMFRKTIRDAINQ